MPITVESIYRYPVKGLRGEALDAVALTAGQGIANDRRFAIARGDTRFDPTAPRWLPKQWFLMLMRDAALARLACRADMPAGTIELRAPGMPACVAAFGSERGNETIEAYLNDFLGPRREGRARWVEAGATSLTDVPQNCLSLVNLASVHALAAHMGRPVDPQRFRANLYVRGAPPWVEFDWVGREIRIGETVLRIPARIPRCAATAVDPATGERDLNIVKGLRAAYGHYDMGVYAEVARGGHLGLGEVLTTPADARPRSGIGHWLRFFTFLARSAPIVFRRRARR